MNNVLHFAKVFGICWVITMVAYITVVFRGGFGVSVGWMGSHPPIWAMQMFFWLWPTVPVLLIAALWEITRAVRSRLVR